MSELGTMELLTARFTGKARLLVLALMSGTSGARRALCVFKKQQSCNINLSLHAFLDMLCQKDISPASYGEPIVPRPLVCLFPTAFKRNLLSFLRLVTQVLPRTEVLQLLECLKNESRPDAWVTALVGQLRRDLGSVLDEPLYTATCGQRMNVISERLNDPSVTEGWSKYFTDQKGTCQGGEDLSIVGRKRKNSLLTPHTEVDEDTQQQKRMRMDVSSVEDSMGGHPHGSSRQEDQVLMEGREWEDPKVEFAKRPTSNLCDLPENVKASVPQIKELLSCPTEWDQGSTDHFKVLNECDSAQLEMLCAMLCLSDTPEETLPKLCCCLSALSPELSYGAASAVIKCLLVGKVQGLLEPACRCLVMAVTSLCSQYPRAVCHALIGPILQKEDIGNHQAELLNRIIEDCLDPHYNLLVFKMIFSIVWNESILSIIQSLVDSMLDMDEQLFTDFIAQLVSQAPHFLKSMKFAKILLSVLTKYSCHVTALHKQSLLNCLILNQTFLKKSLQAAFKRITQ